MDGWKKAYPETVPIQKGRRRIPYIWDEDAGEYVQKERPQSEQLTL